MFSSFPLQKQSERLRIRPNHSAAQGQGKYLEKGLALAWSHSQQEAVFLIRKDDWGLSPRPSLFSLDASNSAWGFFQLLPCEKGAPSLPGRLWKIEPETGQRGSQWGEGEGLCRIPICCLLTLCSLLLELSLFMSSGFCPSESGFFQQMSAPSTHVCFLHIHVDCPQGIQESSLRSKRRAGLLPFCHSGTHRAHQKLCVWGSSFSPLLFNLPFHEPFLTS